MATMGRYVVLTAWLLVLPLSPHAAHAALSGYVVAITDGDTIQLLDDQHRQHKIRIAGIDAPEKAQAFGSKSQTNLGRLAFQKQAVADCPKRDRYDRLICKVVVDGRDIGLQQIADGMAWWYRRYSSEQSSEDRQLYEQAEVMARMRRIGLWMDSIPQPPWEWRKSN